MWVPPLSGAQSEQTRKTVMQIADMFKPHFILKNLYSKLADWARGESTIKVATQLFGGKGIFYITPVEMKIAYCAGVVSVEMFEQEIIDRNDPNNVIVVAWRVVDLELLEKAVKKPNQITWRDVPEEDVVVRV